MDRIDQRFKSLDGQYSINCTGEGVDIYIIDTGTANDFLLCKHIPGTCIVGIYYNHSEFEGRALYPGYDPMDIYERDNRQGADCDGHGTHVASIAAGKTYGAAKNARVYSVRALNCIGVAPWSVIIDAIDYAARHASESNRSSIISMSLSGGFSSVVNAAISTVINDRGIPVVVSAGNAQTNACYRSPASTPEAITVGATSITDKIYEDSNGGSCVDIFAPGDGIRGASYYCSNCTDVFSGTSSSAALVSGVIATVLEKNPLLTPQQIAQHLIDISSKNMIDLSPIRSDIREDTPNRLLFAKGIYTLYIIDL